MKIAAHAQTTYMVAPRSKNATSASGKKRYVLNAAGAVNGVIVDTGPSVSTSKSVVETNERAMPSAPKIAKSGTAAHAAPIAASRRACSGFGRKRTTATMSASVV